VDSTKDKGESDFHMKAKFKPRFRIGDKVLVFIPSHTLYLAKIFGFWKEGYKVRVINLIKVFGSTQSQDLKTESQDFKPEQNVHRDWIEGITQWDTDILRIICEPSIVEIELFVVLKDVFRFQIETMQDDKVIFI